MDKNIDLKSSNIRTDLIMESIETNNITTKIKEKNIEDITINYVNVKEKEEKLLGKTKGNYITITFKDVTNYEDREKIGKVLEEEIIKLLKLKKIKEKDSGLIIGLGNINSTPDALGPKTIKKTLVTRHLFLLNANVNEGIRNVSVVAPGVTATTGIETADYIKALVDLIKPKFLIVIDALAAYSIERVNKTIQMTDTGIHPGSGVGNNRKEISYSTLNIPVIAIGVPTVVDATTIVNESLNYLLKHISYIKNNSEINKLTFTHSKDYINKIKNLDLEETEKEKLLGLIGTLNDITKKNLIHEVLNAIDYNLIVTPKEIDFIIEKISEIISSAINNALHRQITHY